METTSIDYFEELILSEISTGSGINCNWKFEYSNKKCRMSNSYYLMDEYGFYMGFIDFTISFPAICADEDITFSLDEIKDKFKLTFQTNSRGYYWIDKIDLRTYLDEQFYFDFSRMVENKEIELQAIIEKEVM